MKKIIITGGSGTVGTAFIQKYYKKFKFYNISRNESQISNLKNNFPEVKNYISDILNLVPDAMYEHQRPFDVFTYQLQGRHNVYAYHHPLFYQADAKNNANKWEHITRTPLRLKSQVRLGTMS